MSTVQAKIQSDAKEEMSRSQREYFLREQIQALKRELGDVLWYLSALAQNLNIDLDDVATTNLNKLFDRKARGTINSTGDYR